MLQAAILVLFFATALKLLNIVVIILVLDDGRLADDFLRAFDALEKLVMVTDHDSGHHFGRLLELTFYQAGAPLVHVIFLPGLPIQIEKAGVRVF